MHPFYNPFEDQFCVLPGWLDFLSLPSVPGVSTTTLYQDDGTNYTAGTLVWNNHFLITSAGAHRLSVGTDGFVWNNDGTAGNFRVASSGKTHMLFVDVTNNAFGINTDDPLFVREGLTKLSQFGVLKDDTAASQAGFFALASSTGARAVDVSFLKCRGTWASKTAVVNGDIVLNLDSQGYDGTDFNRSAIIQSFIDGVVSTDTVPTGWAFQTSETNAVGLVNRFRIRGNGVIQLGGPIGAPTITFNSVTGATVINEQGNDADTRIEGDNFQNLVFVDASADRAGINTNAPAVLFHVNQSSTTIALAAFQINQADVDEPFYKLVGSAAAGNLTRNIVAVGDVATATIAGYVKMEVDDQGNQIADGDYFKAIYTLA